MAIENDQAVEKKDFEERFIRRLFGQARSHTMKSSFSHDYKKKLLPTSGKYSSIHKFDIMDTPEMKTPIKLTAFFCNHDINGYTLPFCDYIFEYGKLTVIRPSEKTIEHVITQNEVAILGEDFNVGENRYEFGQVVLLINYFRDGKLDQLTQNVQKPALSSTSKKKSQKLRELNKPFLTAYKIQKLIDCMVEFYKQEGAIKKKQEIEYSKLRAFTKLVYQDLTEKGTLEQFYHTRMC